MRRPLCYFPPVRRTIPLVLALLSPVLALLVPAGASHAASEGFSHVWDRGPGGERYVALGDSFTSGPGIAPMRPEPCMRSTKNFPSLFARAMDEQLPGGLNAYTDASCGGARTKDLWSEQSGGDLRNPPQLDALDASTTLVTFGTLGGNDVGLVQLAMSCFLSDCVPAPGEDPLAAAFADLRDSLYDGIEAARTRAPNARILVVGYGTYLPPGGCVDRFGGALTTAEFGYVQGQIDRMSDTLAEVAAEQGVEFVDMRDIPGSLEHTACAEPQKQWIRALETYDDGVTLHPSACGMDAMAQHLTRTVQALDGRPLTPFDPSCTSAGPVAPQPVPEPVDDRAERLAELRAQARTLRVRTSCHRKKVKAVVRGKTAQVSRVVFRVGGKRFAVDRKAPFRATLRKHRAPRRGKVKVVATLRDAELKVTRTVRKNRPRCLR